ncbi:cytochrome P450 [Mycena rosella]|uniref:Cytochrome P450 n=1 Tax=Mycena rosella TaxID=1033263 RepID=A0AAD7D6Q6_MYCRO|nr:cytochrome P450 [Mycena rosella]
MSLAIYLGTTQATPDLPVRWHLGIVLIVAMDSGAIRSLVVLPSCVMDPSLFLSAVCLGVANHAILNRFEPRGANAPFLFLTIQPMVLLLFFGGAFSPARLMWTYVVFLASISLSIVAYRLSPFHPLAQFKGPTIGKVSKLWGLWIAWRGYQYLYHKRLHDKYGPWVRIGPNELSVNDAHAVSQILSVGGLDKGRFYEAERHPSTPPSIVALSGEAHAAKRRVWNRAMTSASMREYEPRVAQRATRLISRLGDENGTVDLVAWFSLFALDLMGDLAFGGGFEMLEDGEDVAGVKDKIALFMASASLAGQIPWIVPTLQLLPQVGRVIQEFNEFGQGLAIQRVVRGGSGVKDLWYHLADEAGLEKVQPILEDSAADGIVAIIAASDTTASALSSLVWFLLSSPEYYRRVQLELDTVFVDGDDPLDVSKHAQLRFLSACINETLRLHPPTPSIGTRQVEPTSAGRTFAARFIPAGTSMYTPPYALHRNPAYFFPHPDQFVPDRWLPESNFAKHDTAAFIPFSLGSANCVGQKFAKRQLMMVTSLLLKSFNLRFAVGFDSEAWPGHIRDYFVATRGPLLVDLTPR